MNTNLWKVSLRQGAILIDNIQETKDMKISVRTANFVKNINKLGFTTSEELLKQLNQVSNGELNQLFDYLKQIMGIKANWTPLVKGWDTPTDETYWDHYITYIYNILHITDKSEGALFPCGHFIPFDTFPLERYNGCPFCGTPFVFAEYPQLTKKASGSKLKVLELWSNTNINNFYKDLLTSKTALDATQVDSLKILLQALPLHEVKIVMKETMILVVDTMIEQGKGIEVGKFFTIPTDILRYLWYKHTGFLQIIEPKTIVKRAQKNNKSFWEPKNKKKDKQSKDSVLLKYDRTTCRMVAQWMNNLSMDSEKICESMHPKRGMWVRLIRALRLAEYSKKAGFQKLKEILDIFYNQVYETWQGEVNRNRLKVDPMATFKLLKQRPGLFARSLFANMLWFGDDITLEAFAEIANKIPARLLITLSMYATNYFDANQKRIAKPLGGTSKVIPANALLSLLTEEECTMMAKKVKEMVEIELFVRFAEQKNENRSIYIDPQLFNIPLAIGDRSETIQDFSCALQGTRFPLASEQVRVFMQWGMGLPAQHLDLDLSVHITYKNNVEVCSYFNLVTAGAKHSGDIRSIPNQIGTAEYVELDLKILKEKNAKYVTFTCNAYSTGAISPTVVLGWMNSKNRMKISEKTGVAYDPSCVLHQVRVANPLTKGLVFGVVDVEASELIWMEIPFAGQTVLGLNSQSIETYIKKLNSKLSIGELLTLKAQAQELEMVDKIDADEIYDLKWALNTAATTQLLID